MKKALLLFVLVASLASFSSCKKSSKRTRGVTYTCDLWTREANQATQSWDTILVTHGVFEHWTGTLQELYETVTAGTDTNSTAHWVDCY